MNILDVQLRDNLKAADHIDSVLASRTWSLYALRLLRAKWLASPALHKVSMATTMACMLYAAPAWWGLTSADEKSKLERFKDKVTRMVTYKQMIHPLLTLLLHSLCSDQWSEILTTSSKPFCHQRPPLVMTCDHDLIDMSCPSRMTETLSQDFYTALILNHPSIKTLYRLGST